METMDALEVQENIFATGDAKVHGQICRKLSAIVFKVLEIFPVLEAARPRSKSGLESLCSLHVALDKSKNLLQHCSNNSRLYLAITGDSIILKFEKTKCALQESLRCVENIVPQSIGCQIMEIVSELEETTFVLEETEKRAGEEIIQLLQKEKKFNDSTCDTETEELEIFHQSAIQLGITSSRAALTERRALKKLFDRARVEEDKRKESIVAYLLHLMRKYSKLFRSEVSDETDSQGSAPCSPTVQGGGPEYGDGQSGNCHLFERQLSRPRSFNFKPTGMRSTSMPIPPEELRCPISLQLMYDPVIISSGQTYERVCIEKWFSDGHNTCPKTQQQLSHLYLTPNYCVKGLIGSWCDQNGLPVPVAPPDSPDLNYWRLALSECELTDSRSMGSIESCKANNIKVVPLAESVAKEEDSGIRKEFEVNQLGGLGNTHCQDRDVDEFVRYENLLSVLYNGKCLEEQLNAIEQIRFLLKDDEESRTYMGANGFTEGLAQFLRSAVEEGNENAQEVGAMALFNLAVNNNRNKRSMLSAGVVPLLEEMIRNTAYEAATALYLNISCLDDAKPVIGSSCAVPFLVQLIKTGNYKAQCRADALHTLYNLSSHSPNIPSLLRAGIIDGLHSLISGSYAFEEVGWAEKSIAVFTNLALSKLGKKEIMSTPGVVGAIASVLDTGDPSEQEQAVSCLLNLCNGDQTCCHMVLQEGVIPALVSISVNGTTKGKEKAQKLLMLFREHRQRDTSPVRRQQQVEENNECNAIKPEKKSLVKSASKRRLGRTLSAMWKNKHFSVYQC